MGLRKVGDGHGPVTRKPRYLSRRDFLKLGGAGLAGAALLGSAGCGGGGQELQTGGVPNLVLSSGPDNSGSLDEVVSRFNKQYEGEINVELRIMPNDTGEHFNQLRTELQAGASRIDFMIGDLTWTAQLAANGWITDLSDKFTPQMREKFVGAPLESAIYQDKAWAVPFFTDVGLMYYRKDLVEEAGFSNPPETWDELKQMAVETRDKTGTANGFVFQGSEYEGHVVDALEYIWTHGGEALTEDQTVTVDNPEPISGLETERSMIEDNVAPVFVTTFKEPETHSTFLNGDAVFARNWPYMYGLASDPALSQIELDQIGIAPIPHAQGNESAGGLGGWNFYVKDGPQERIDAAWEFIQFAITPEIEKFRSLEGGFLPPLVDLYQDQEIRDNVPVTRFAQNALETARTRPVSPFYSDISLVMSAQFSRSLQGNAAPDQAARNLQTEMRNIIDLGDRLLV